MTELLEFNDKKVGILTLGCRVNQYESQAIAEKLETYGFKISSFDDDNDVYIINTCSVTGESDKKSRQMIRRALRRKQQDPTVVVAAVGCFVQGIDNLDEYSELDYIGGNVGKSELPDRLCELFRNKQSGCEVNIIGLSNAKYENLQISKNNVARAFVKIEDGCNSFCSYCFVPFVRGRVRSRLPDEIVSEVKRLSSNGFNEVVLTGIETSCYGEDLDGKIGLVELVEKIENIDGIDRIRFGSLKPTIFTEDFIKRISGFNKVEKHFHLSLQSGSSNVLSAMRRDYSKEDIKRVFESIYKYMPDACLSADIICGFPGESETDFRDSCDIVKMGELLHTHIFPYSKRKNTKAAEMPNQTPEEIKRSRATELGIIALEVSKAKIQSFKNRELTILVERIADGKSFGYTENFIYTETPNCKGDQLGNLKNVVLNGEYEIKRQQIIAKIK